MTALYILLSGKFGSLPDAQAWTDSQSGFYAKKGITLRIVPCSGLYGGFYVWRSCVPADHTDPVCCETRNDWRKQTPISVVEYLRKYTPYALWDGKGKPPVTAWVSA